MKSHKQKIDDIIEHIFGNNLIDNSEADAEALLEFFEENDFDFWAERVRNDLGELDAEVLYAHNKKYFELMTEFWRTQNELGRK